MVSGRWVLRFGAVVFVVLVNLIAAHAPVRAAEEPNGFREAKFGMNEAELRKLFPDLKDITEPTPTPASESDKPSVVLRLKQFALEDQSVGPFKHCQATLGLFVDKFYEVRFECSEPMGKIVKHFNDTYGDPTSHTDNSLTWKLQHVTVTVLTRTPVFSFADTARSELLGRTVMSYLLQQGIMPGMTVQQPAPVPQP